MTKIGVIGVGTIGRDHIRRLSTTLAGAQIVAIADANRDAAHVVAATLPEASVHERGLDLIADPNVEAVMVCSWGPTHEEYVLASIARGKPVFCEKPLATTSEACLNILAAEVQAGRRLVQVGFMRRYDPAYAALRAVIATGEIGTPLLYRSSHRNPAVPAHYTSDMAISDTAVHDIDVSRWLLSDEVHEISVIKPRQNSRGGDLLDPLLILLRMRGGAVVTVETSVNIAYGYDIGGEVVGETGVASLADRHDVVIRHFGAARGRVPADWRERFSLAYDIELRNWLDAIADASCTGPSAWDGYAATAVAEAGLEALQSGQWVRVALADKPALYNAAHAK